MRRSAKTVNFGIVYGQSDFGLSEQLGITRKEAHDFIEKYFISYPNIKTFMDQTIAFCRNMDMWKHYSIARRYIKEINDKIIWCVNLAKEQRWMHQFKGSALKIKHNDTDL